MPNVPAVAILFSVAGILLIVLALMSQRLQRWIGIKPVSQLFTQAGFRRSARLTQILGQVVLVILGLTMVVYGAGDSFLSAGVVHTLTIALLALVWVMVVSLFVVVLIHWKGE
jgi:drug/metabolite transporter (DMT)-like permease